MGTHPGKVVRQTRSCFRLVGLTFHSQEGPVMRLRTAVRATLASLLIVSAAFAQGTSGTKTKTSAPAASADPAPAASGTTAAKDDKAAKSSSTAAPAGSAAPATGAAPASTATASTTSPVPAGPATGGASSAGASTSAAGASSSMDGSTYAVRLRDLESKVDELKEQIRRSHTRLSLLSDTILSGGVGGSRAEIRFKNEMSNAFRLTRALFVLDGAVQYNKE